MQYLKGTLDLKLCLGGKDVSLRGYCDADWGGDANEWRSTTGYVFLIGVGAVSWNYKRQLTIALSTTEAKYMAISQCTKEAIWLRKLMADVGLVQDGATSIMCDNQGCIALAKKPTHHSRTKHIDIQHHFIQEKLESGELGLKYFPTQDMVADVWTKALAKERHQNLTRSMGLGVLDYLLMKRQPRHLHYFVNISRMHNLHTFNIAKMSKALGKHFAMSTKLKPSETSCFFEGGSSPSKCKEGEDLLAHINMVKALAD
jgi:hypothetical protein